ncbi:hypothetical protein, partial [Amycolatopsis rhizosphaerae]|uniref:hypothetical protein n=1 Tax=Amycolatopsis rhizosphaerae TaxID=2053003 RepID=UPI001FE70599
GYVGGTWIPRPVLVTAVVAALVTAGSLAAVASLRVARSGDKATIEASAPAPSVTPDRECGGGPCDLLTTRSAGGAQVELRADATGANGRVQVNGIVVPTTISELGARLTADSLTCVTANVSACLVGAPLKGGRVAQLLVGRGDGWQSVDKPYFSDAGVIVLDTVTGADAPDVVVVQASPALARVYALDGSAVGCTRKYAAPSQLRGWPQVHVLPADLRPCP